MDGWEDRQADGQTNKQTDKHYEAKTRLYEFCERPCKRVILVQ